MLGIVGYVAAVLVITVGPVDLDFWTEIGLILFAAGATLRD